MHTHPKTASLFSVFDAPELALSGSFVLLINSCRPRALGRRPEAQGGGISQTALKFQIADTPNSPGALQGGVGPLILTGTASACLQVAQGVLAAKTGPPLRGNSTGNLVT